ncbi:putative multi antimicrobial extrusion protein [Helianthus annuus]|uniref:Protein DETOXIFICATION n=1 Tax=Helianthus annuus TaxID=4232 RepID=A0A251VEE2_HELAN|nr:protein DETOXIFICATION 31 [Helianthus annuus]KAF5817921.1 putative multi antimicrobial extrusion protein [Helianthus annuus]KAJ0614795.1 putative multi antimicrobial extrusion protein [Helianthus annuus]KAJ0618340.1 putative multi antimicrobial extrusion protein [Helianthus annuus]KAJ0804997.1 putative multi antimicrobial extrusion protein [Helianthus annuus]
MDSNAETPLLTSKHITTNAHFTGDAQDIPPINGISDFFVEFGVESKKLWYLAGPAIFTTVCQYSLGAITQTFAGHVGTLDLAAVSIENSVIAGFSLGIMVGMGSALETLCGQAYGAGQLDMLGIYMQRSWIILFVTGLIMMFLYIFATPLLLLIGQTEAISHAAGKMALWMIPQLFAYAANYPIAKFLQAQSKIMVMSYISGVALVIHTVFSWLFMLKLGWGLWGGALVLNFSWWFMVVAQMVYIMSGTCGQAWSGFSWAAFSNLWGFVKLSFASAIMLCLETWYFMALVLFAGYLKNAEIAVDALSICTNILGWAVMVAIGFNAAVSVRVSNELGAAHPRTAKFSVVVVVIFSFIVGVLLAILLTIFRHQYPAIFANNLEVQQAVYALTPLLAVCLIINNIQPALSGVAIGAGWQAAIAYINIACYYIFGVPLGLSLGFALNWGVKGIWMGMLTGTVVQTIILIWICVRTNWEKEASMAEERIRKWSGQKRIVEEQ